MALIPPVKRSPTASTIPIPFLHKQFPVTLSFASTVNKAQGQTFSRAGIYLPSDIFSHRQLYVAMSQVGKPSALNFFFSTSLSPPVKPGTKQRMWYTKKDTIGLKVDKVAGIVLLVLVTLGRSRSKSNLKKL
jgi:hypothetical protein